MFTITPPRRAIAACERAPYVSRVFSAELKPALPFLSFFLFCFCTPISFPRRFYFSPQKVCFTAAEICVFVDVFVPNHTWSTMHSTSQHSATWWPNGKLVGTEELRPQHGTLCKLLASGFAKQANQIIIIGTLYSAFGISKSFTT